MTQDERSRNLERRWRATGDLADRQAWLEERVRLGDLGQDLARVLRLTGDPQATLSAWQEAVESWPVAIQVRTAVAAIRALHRYLDAGHWADIVAGELRPPIPQVAQEAVSALVAWLDSPSAARLSCEEARRRVAACKSATGSWAQQRIYSATIPALNLVAAPKTANTFSWPGCSRVLAEVAEARREALELLRGHRQQLVEPLETINGSTAAEIDEAIRNLEREPGVIAAVSAELDRWALAVG